jgi:predicted naringenin-chalcone synthase
MPDLTEGGKHIALTTTTVPDIWYKAQRVLRTVVQVGIPAFLTFALVLPQIIAALGLPVDSALYLWLVAAAAAVTAVAGALARVMAIPQVNAFLVKIGLGSVPAAAVQPPHELYSGTSDGDR